MDTLILSCGTGGGHNSAALAIKEEMERRGHNVTMFNPFDLSSKALSEKIDNAYIRTAKNTPGLFGAVYTLGNLYRNLPIHSPVYHLNGLMAEKMDEYLKSHHADLIIMTHVFAAHILTFMKEKGYAVPKTVLIATDYTCIPFTEECICDAYVIPSAALKDEFVYRGIPEDRIYPLGIPVRSGFREQMSRDKAKQRLGLDTDKKYILVAGGSIGAGRVQKAVEILSRIVKDRPELRIAVICGNNTHMYDSLSRRFGSSIELIGRTDCMHLYLKACQLFITKPGGLSTTEAAVSGTLLCLLPGIPGCETRNLHFFTQRGMCSPTKISKSSLAGAAELLYNEGVQRLMPGRQAENIPKDAAAKICQLGCELVNKTDNISPEYADTFNQAIPELLGFTVG